MSGDRAVGTVQAARAARLLELHSRPEILVLRNVWDVMSARAVATRTDTTAIATASWAVATSHGYDDGENIPWPLHLACVQRICATTELPVTVDIERGYGDPVATVLDVIRAGAVGVNIEDGLAPAEDFARVVAAVRSAAGRFGLHLVINARSDEFLLSPETDLARVIDAARAYLAAGADCVFVPGVTAVTDIERLVREIGPQRLSLLALPGLPSATELEGLGVARLSHGPALQRATAEFVSNWT